MVGQHFDRMQRDPSYREAVTLNEIDTAAEIAAKYGMVSPILGSLPRETTELAFRRLEARELTAKRNATQAEILDQAALTLGDIESGARPALVKRAIKLLHGRGERTLGKAIAIELRVSPTSGSTNKAFARLDELMLVHSTEEKNGYQLNQLGEMVAMILLGLVEAEANTTT